MADRVFLDANVLFSAAYRSNAGLARLWNLPGVLLLSSEYAIREAQINLNSAEQHKRMLELKQSLEVVGEVPAGVVLPADILLPKKDRPILLAAIHSGASHLLTGDINDFGPLFGRIVAGVMILRPSEYLRKPG